MNKKKLHPIIEFLSLFLILSLIFVGFILQEKRENVDITGFATSWVNVSSVQQRNCDFQLTTGRNLVSFHCIRSVQSHTFTLESIENNYNYVFEYTGSSGDSWKVRNPSLPSYVYQDLQWFSDSNGYWLFMQSNDSYFFNGSVSSVDEISLSTGWNLVGHPRNTTQNITTALSSINGNYSIILAYNSTSNQWQSYGPLGNNSLQVIEANRGYWINATNSTTWVINW